MHTDETSHIVNIFYTNNLPDFPLNLVSKDSIISILKNLLFDSGVLFVCLSDEECGFMTNILINYIFVF